MNGLGWIGVGLVMAFVVAFWSVLWAAEKDCNAAGGVYVRQAIGFACVTALPMKK